jgi:hypothetical protein
LFEKIFNVEVLEFTLTGYRGGSIKVSANIRYYAGIIRRLLNIVRKLSDSLYGYMTRWLCNPVEINMVIRNSKKDPSRS